MCAFSLTSTQPDSIHACRSDPDVVRSVAVSVDSDTVDSEAHKITMDDIYMYMDDPDARVSLTGCCMRDVGIMSTIRRGRGLSFPIAGGRA